jgi:hypothetical protein
MIKKLFISLVILLLLVIFLIKCYNPIETRFRDPLYWPSNQELAGEYMVEEESRKKIFDTKGINLSSTHKLIIYENRTLDFIDLDPFFDLEGNADSIYSCYATWDLGTYFLLKYNLHIYTNDCWNRRYYPHHYFHIKVNKDDVYLIYNYSDFQKNDYIVYKKVSE